MRSTLSNEEYTLLWGVHYPMRSTPSYEEYTNQFIAIQYSTENGVIENCKTAEWYNQVYTLLFDYRIMKH